MRLCSIRTLLVYGAILYFVWSNNGYVWLWQSEYYALALRGQKKKKRTRRSIRCTTVSPLVNESLTRIRQLCRSTIDFGRFLFRRLFRPSAIAAAGHTQRCANGQRCVQGTTTTTNTRTLGPMSPVPHSFSAEISTKRTADGRKEREDVTVRCAPRKMPYGGVRRKTTVAYNQTYCFSVEADCYCRTLVLCHSSAIPSPRFYSCCGGVV